jgi:hypothetical protein
MKLSSHKSQHGGGALFAAIPLALTLLVARPGSAQQGYPSGPPGAEQYRLTLAALRKVMPALRGQSQAACRQGEAKRDPFAMTLAEMAAALKRCEPVRAALAKTGASTSEAATVFGAVLYAGRRITQEESAKAAGSQAPPLPAGPLKDNVVLLRENEAELRRLTQPPPEGPGS